ncbi:DNA-binding NarL/FixJ family response regulator [Micromonospora luteifusca]|uniref:DNA-binding NarL/FixJ family response regulator n=1 Tax=Micromonospora luteifusca TaxID=709860 RepID=A0ABS2LMQ4_9ACTN|nr:response regulator transcription factor [Micromonospora luteifusca]MBM7489478.1 DNA-binding NarL/FixJ family response regulator [Micromonospora luteifusca]
MHPRPTERAAIRAVLDTDDRVHVVACTGDGGEALALARQLRPTVTLLDDRVPAPDSMDLVGSLAQRSLVIAMTSVTEHGAITAKLCAPVRGCLVYGHFEPADLLGAVRAVASGLAWLSPVAVAAVICSLRVPAVS